MLFPMLPLLAMSQASGQLGRRKFQDKQRGKQRQTQRDAFDKLKEIALHKQQAKSDPYVSQPYNEGRSQIDALEALSGMSGNVEPGMQSAISGMMGLLAPPEPEAGGNYKAQTIGNQGYSFNPATGEWIEGPTGPQNAGSAPKKNWLQEQVDMFADLYQQETGQAMSAEERFRLGLQLSGKGQTGIQEVPGMGAVEHSPHGGSVSDTMGRLFGGGGAGGGNNLQQAPQPGTEALPEMQAMNPAAMLQPPPAPGPTNVLRTPEQIAQTEAEASRIKKQADAALDIPALELDVNAAIGRVDDLLKNESLPSGVGVWDQYLAGGKSLLPFNQGTAGFLRDHEAVMSDKILQELTSIKASGATLGQITEKELEVLKTAKENLSRGQSEADFRENARKLKDAYRDIMSKLKLKAGQNPAATGSAPEVISIDEAIRRRQSGGST